MAADLPEAEFAAMIGVRTEQLAALERDGLPTVGKAKKKRYPVPRAITWFIEYSVDRRVGGVPPRVNQHDLAALIGVTPRTVSNLVTAGTISSLIEKGKRVYPLPVVVHEFIKYQKELGSTTKGKEMDPLDAARLRKLNADAEQAEMDLLRKRGELLDRVTSERAISEILQALRSQGAQAPGRYDKRFVQLPTAAVARALLREMFNAEFTRWGATVAGIGRRIQVVAEDLTPDEEEPAPDAAPVTESPEPVAADG